ncbi:DDHD domain-containing protein [Chytridium lagenaria]|nr:DDHD domain-containing protein [Chytridium lagenaria]
MEGAPEATIRWFHATDVPKSDTTPFRIIPAASVEPAKTPKVPTNWLPFSTRDSNAIETVWQALQKLKASGDKSGEATDYDLAGSKIQTRVSVNEDHLYEVDVAKKEIYPVYWYGATFDIRRGTWFMSADGVKFMPCDDNLTRQLEDGYTKFKPWKADQSQSSTITTHISSTDPAPATEQPPQEPPTQKAAEAKATAISKPELRWALFGPWMNSFVLFSGTAGGWLFSDQLSSKWARAFMSGITRGENQGGTRVVRGWAEVEKLKKGTATKQKRKSVPDKASAAGVVPGDAPIQERVAAEQAEKDKEAEEFYDGEEPDRQINHLILVIHGIGQKLGERLENVNFVQDCSVLRHAIKDGSRNIVIPTSSKEAQKPGNKKPTLPMPDLGGVQVLPVQWRQKINFGRNKKDPVLDQDDDDRVDIDEITLDGVPSIRMLVSDVALDVLLYMTPKYRQEMVKHVTDEMNRIYRTFMQRNPKFNGKVSIYGHSLGSLLAFDILCNQPYEADTAPAGIPIPSAKPSPKPLRVKGMSEVDLSDMLRGAFNSNMRESRKVNGLLEPVEIKYEKLEFDVDKLFAVGSPVGLFLLLKGDRLKARKPDDVSEIGLSRPAVNSLYNIFHPHDPIAYRFEPLVAKSYAPKRPFKSNTTKVVYTNHCRHRRHFLQYRRSRQKYILRDYSTTSISLGCLGVVGSASDLTPALVASSIQSMSGPGTPVAVNTPPPPPKSSLNAPAGVDRSIRQKTSGDSLGQLGDPPVEAAGSVNSSTVSLVASAADEEEMKRLNPTGRIDYVLQEGVLENAYLSSLSSHMTYWPDQDIAVFILKELYGTTGSGLQSTAPAIAPGTSPRRQ